MTGPSRSCPTTAGHAWTRSCPPSWPATSGRPHLAPTLTAMTGGPITSVAPSTTATALTSLTTGAPPAAHGVLGYRILVPTGEVLNVLRWTTPSGDARENVPPETIQRLEPFGGTKPGVVTKAEFWDSGFSRVHLAGTELHGWRYASTLVVHVASLVREGQPFVYAYYPGVDAVAHEMGFGEAYDAEVAAADRLVGDLLAALPSGTAVVVVADHGQVEVGDRVVPLDGEIASLTALLSGEGRFRWLHAHPSAVDRLTAVARERFRGLAWVSTREELIAEGWLGGRPSEEAALRLGDVALVAHAPIAFMDP